MSLLGFAFVVFSLHGLDYMIYRLERFPRAGLPLARFNSMKSTLDLMCPLVYPLDSASSILHDSCNYAKFSLEAGCLGKTRVWSSGVHVSIPVSLTTMERNTVNRQSSVIDQQMSMFREHTGQDWQYIVLTRSCSLYESKRHNMVAH